jgi:RNA polymerase sigma-70 factor (ECF subfamily)
MRQPTSNLEALVARLADGDRTAFDPLYEALWPVVRRLADRLLLGSPEAEDAAQEAMTKLFSQVSRFEPGRSVTTWVLAITAYECKTLRQRRHRRREAAVTNLAESSDEGALSPEATTVARDLEAAALEVMGTLAPADQDTLEAWMCDARPSIPAATFRKRLERTLNRLREAWKARHDTD